MKPNRVIVSWVDSASTIGWRNPEDVSRIANCESTGYLVSKEKDHLLLALNHSLERDTVPFGGFIAIPTKALTQIRHIKEPKRGRR